MNKTIFQLFSVVILLVSCGDNERDLSSAVLKASTIEEAAKYAKRIEGLKEDALPILTSNLRALQSNEYAAINYGKIDVCLTSLLSLAKKGIHSREEGLILVDVIMNQKAITSTLKTAEILKHITGIDVGYNRAFVESYTSNSEMEREEMVGIWRRSLKDEEWKRSM